MKCSIEIYPLTIVNDRYDGYWSGGAYTAWNLQPCSVPSEIYADEMICASYWSDNDPIIGRGTTPEEAHFDLFCMMREERLKSENLD